MNSKQRTQIYFDDPNSYWQASRKEMEIKKKYIAKSKRTPLKPPILQTPMDKIALDKFISDLILLLENINFSLNFLKGRGPEIIQDDRLSQYEYEVIDKLNSGVKLAMELFYRLPNFGIAMFPKDRIKRLMLLIRETLKLRQDNFPGPNVDQADQIQDNSLHNVMVAITQLVNLALGMMTNIEHGLQIQPQQYMDTNNEYVPPPPPPVVPLPNQGVFVDLGPNGEVLPGQAQGFVQNEVEEMDPDQQQQQAVLGEQMRAQDVIIQQEIAREQANNAAYYGPPPGIQGNNQYDARQEGVLGEGELGEIGELYGDENEDDAAADERFVREQEMRRMGVNPNPNLRVQIANEHQAKMEEAKQEALLLTEEEHLAEKLSKIDPDRQRFLMYQLQTIGRNYMMFDDENEKEAIDLQCDIWKKQREEKAKHDRELLQRYHNPHEHVAPTIAEKDVLVETEAKNKTLNRLGRHRAGRK